MHCHEKAQIRTLRSLGRVGESCDVIHNLMKDLYQVKHMQRNHRKETNDYL